MDDQAFKKVLGGSNVKGFIVGLFIMAFGVFIAWLYISGADKSSDIGVGGEIVLVLLIILCLGIGGFTSYVGIKSSFQIRTGKHGILNAMNVKDNGYLIWIFENITKIQGGGSTHQVWAYNREGKLYNFTVKKDKVQPLIKYLVSHFPNAALGYSDEIADRMKQNVGIKSK